MFDSLVTLFPDTSGYTTFADIMRESADWFHHADLYAYADITHFRLPFYPGIIAFSKTLFGASGGLFFLALVQLSLFGFSLKYFFSFLRDLNFSHFSTTFSTFGFALGLPLFYATAILTDSLYISLGLLVLISTGKYFLEKSKKTDHIILIFSLIFMSFLRETTPYFALSLLVFVLLLLCQKQLRKAIILCFMIFIPVLGALGTIMAWNIHRTGEAFLTSGLSTALVVPIIDLKNRYPNLDYTSPLDDYLPEEKPYSFNQGTAAAGKMLADKKLNVLEVAAILKQDYFRTWLKFPRERARIFIANLNLLQFHDVINPAHMVRQFIEHDSERRLPALRNIMSIDFMSLEGVVKLLYLGCINFFRLLSLLLIAFGFYKLYRRMRIPHKTQRDWLYLGFFLQAWGWMFFYSLNHLEPRYVLTSYALFALLAFAPAQKKEADIA